MSTNQRNSFRCPASGQDSLALLRVDGHDHSVRLIDQSLGGFAVTGDKELHVAVGQTVLLGTKAGWNEVELVQVDEVEQRTRIGMRRLAELPDQQLASALQATSLPPLLGGGGYQKLGSPLGRAMAAILLLAPIFWLGMALTSCFPQMDKSLSKFFSWRGESTRSHSTDTNK